MTVYNYWSGKIMAKTIKVVYQDGEETKCKKGELVSEDTFTITIKTFKKDITIGKRFLIESYEID